MILAPSRKLWMPWEWFQEGKFQRDPTTGKIKRSSDGKLIRNSSDSTTCCCGEECNGEPCPTDCTDGPQFLYVTLSGTDCMDGTYTTFHCPTPTPCSSCNYGNLGGGGGTPGISLVCSSVISGGGSTDCAPFDDCERWILTVHDNIPNTRYIRAWREITSDDQPTIGAYNICHIDSARCNDGAGPAVSVSLTP